MAEWGPKSWHTAACRCPACSRPRRTRRSMDWKSIADQLQELGAVEIPIDGLSVRQVQARRQNARFLLAKYLGEDEPTTVIRITNCEYGDYLYAVTDERFIADMVVTVRESGEPHARLALGRDPVLTVLE